MPQKTDKQPKADKFDPYRERLVMETQTTWPTTWPADCPPPDEVTRQRWALQLHSQPDQATHLQYLRTHTGFCRRIVVTPADVARLKGDC